MPLVFLLQARTTTAQTFTISLATHQLGEMEQENLFTNELDDGITVSLPKKESFVAAKTQKEVILTCGTRQQVQMLATDALGSN